MEKEHNLFLKILRRFDKEDVLEDIILIGGWCPLVYREHFGNPLEISMQRTADLDFMVPNPPFIRKEVNVSLIFEELGFDRKVSLLDGFEKYVHPDLEVEFLTPEKGRGKEKPYSIDKLHIYAQGLRYLNYFQNYVMKTSYKNISINVPEPTAYVLHKFIVSNKRKKLFKKEKDIETACQLGEYLLDKADQRKKMQQIYLNMPDKWKKDLIRIIKASSEKLYAFLTSAENQNKGWK